MNGIFLREAGAGGSNPLSPTNKSRFSIVNSCSSLQEHARTYQARAYISRTAPRAGKLTERPSATRVSPSLLAEVERLQGDVA